MPREISVPEVVDRALAPAGQPTVGPEASKRPDQALTIPVPPGLHIVATPIGNLADISLRALATMRRADVIACEDTRVTAKLRSVFAITAPTTPYHEHNAERALPALIARLKRGGTVALVSDAGTPLVSDPGYCLVQAALAEGISVFAAPGASAALAALCVAGLPTDRFFFVGFLPAKGAARQAALAELAAIPATLVIYEAPHRIAPALADIAAVLGPRPAAVCRELTKRHEEVRRGRADELAAAFRSEAAPRGEFVIVVGPPAPKAGARQAPDTDEVDAMLRAALARQGTRDAAAEVAARTGVSRRTLYARALALVGSDRGHGR